MIKIIKWLLWLPVYVVCVLLYAAFLIAGSFLLRIYYVLWFVAGISIIFFIEKNCPIPQWCREFMGFAGIANAILFLFIGYSLKRIVTEFCGKLLNQIKNVVKNKTTKKFVDFDLNQILDCFDASLAVGWDEAAVVLYLYYDQWRDQLEQLTEPQRNFYLVERFRGIMSNKEQNRQGFSFVHSETDTPKHLDTIDALRAVSAYETARILADYLETDMIDWKKCTKEYLSDICKRENLLHLTLDYVRQHKEHFRPKQQRM
ncbi:MAG: hypothetical protein LBI18_12395 [Planctomycetaceae bacterium]|jgi:hypothetical protein|nr:hypothetical protein [Planctomycetaceae bacterium]